MKQTNFTALDWIPPSGRQHEVYEVQCKFSSFEIFGGLLPSTVYNGAVIQDKIENEVYFKENFRLVAQRICRCFTRFSNIGFYDTFIQIAIRNFVI